MASNASQTMTAIHSAPATPISQRMTLGRRSGRRRRSVGAPAGGDVPHLLHPGPAHAPDAVVEVERRVAVGREEFDAVTQPGRARRIGDRQPPVLVAREAVGDAGTLDGLGREGLVGGEGLQPAVHHRAIGRRHAHHRGGHRQRHLELRQRVAGAAADAAVVEVHHAVGAALQLGEPGQLDVDVVRARRAAGDDLHRQPLGFEASARLHQRRHRRARGLAALLPAHHVRAVTRVALQPAQPQRPTVDHGAGEGDGLSRLHAGAPVADVDVDHHVEGHAVLDGRARERVHVLGVVDDDHRVRRLGHQAREPADRARRHHLRGDQEAMDAEARHHLGLAELRARDAEGAGGDLPARDLGTAMGLGVRAQLLAGGAHVLRHALQIPLEAIHVEQQRGRRDLVTRHRDSEPSTDLTGPSPFTRLRSTMPGRPFLQIPGPTLVPERVMRAMAQAVIDHRGPTFGALVHDCLAGLKDVFQTTRGQIVLYPGSGTGAWEAALVNTLSPGDRVLACVNGHFSTGFANTAAAYGMDVERLEVAYGEGVPAERVAARLAADGAHELRAILVVHNETSTGVTSNVAAVRAALDDARHPALLLVDTVSSLASIDFRFDAWGVDVALTGPQEGLMLPPGMAILAASERALTAAEQAKCPRAFWDWRPVLERNRRGEFPYTPATVLLFGLREALAMLRDEGLANVFARHARLAEACRRAVRAWGLELLCRNPAEYSNTLTAVVMPEGFDSDAFVAHVYRRLNLSLGVGLGDVKGRAFRIGHLGSLNELELLGGLAGIEMMLKEFGVPVQPGSGLAAAEEFLTGA